MYISRKKNRFGTTSIVVVDKSGGQYKEIKSFGVARTEADLVTISRKASEWISTYGGQTLVDFDNPNPKARELEETERVLGNLDAIAQYLSLYGQAL